MIDTTYLATNKITNGQLTYLGLKNSVIEFIDQKWQMKVFDSSMGTSASSSAPKATFLLGQSRWMVLNDSCSEGATLQTELKLTGCQEGDFTCTDGQCVSMTHR